MRRPRPRPRWDAVELRAWVVDRPRRPGHRITPHLPEEVDAELSEKLLAIGQVVDVPVAAVSSTLGKLLGIGQVPNDPLVADLQSAACAAAYAAIVDYWQNHPHKGKFFPRIIVRGMPWRVPAGAIHVLDLPLECIERAVNEHPAFREAATATETSVPTDADERFRLLAKAAKSLRPLIRADPVLAASHPAVTDLKRGLLEIAHDHEVSLEVRRDAANLLDDMLEDFRPKQIRKEDRNPDEALVGLATEYQQVKDRLASVEKGLKELRRGPPTLALLRKVRACGLPMTVSLADLKSWRRRRLALHKIAMDLVARRHGTMQLKTLTHKLELAAIVRPIQEAWDDYEKWRLIHASAGSVQARPPLPQMRAKSPRYFRSRGLGLSLP